MQVADGVKLTLNDIPTHNPKITGNGDIEINKTIDGGYPHGIVILDESGNIEANSLTITVGKIPAIDDDKSRWLSKGIMVPQEDKAGSAISIKLEEALNVHSYSGALHSEGGAEASIGIVAQNVNLHSDCDWVIHNNAATSISISAEKDASFKSDGSGGITNNSQKEIKITADNIFVDAYQYYGIAALTGDVLLTANKSNSIICNDNSLNDRGIQNQNGTVIITSLNGDNYIEGGEHGIYASGEAEVRINAAKGDNRIIGTNANALWSVNGPITAAAVNNYIYSEGNAMNADNGVIEVLSQQTTQMIGNVIADNGGSAKAAFDTAESFLLGTVTTDGGATKTSVTNLAFTDGANWYLTGDSNVSHLTLNNGFVDLTENEKGNAHKVAIDKALVGSGVFKLDLTYHDNNVASYENAADSDFIYIHGGDGSEQNIAFADNDGNLGKMRNGDKLYFAQAQSESAVFGQGETITRVNQNELYDKLFTIESEESQKINYNDWFITCTGGRVNPNGEAPAQSYKAGLALWRDDDTLLKRLGELRYTNDEGGVWTRVIGKKLEDKRALSFSAHAKTVQVGYDRKDVQKDGSGTWRKGIALGHTWADTSFGGGSGENNYTDLSLYATNIRKHDHYWDFVVRFGRIDSEYDTVYGDHGEFDNWAGSLSAEYGRKKKMNDANWFIEPQAQLTYSYLWGDSYTTSKGIKVNQDNADSLVGRAGFVISKELESERKYPNRYYAKAFIMHEFLDGGDNTVSLGSDRFYAGSDFKDTWYVVGIGANADMGNNCTFYFDAEKNFRAHVKMPYRVEAGFRWEF